MHPNKFFKEVCLRTDIDTVEIFDGDLWGKIIEKKQEKNHGNLS